MFDDVWRLKRDISQYGKNGQKLLRVERKRTNKWVRSRAWIMVHFWLKLEGRFHKCIMLSWTSCPVIQNAAFYRFSVEHGACGKHLKLTARVCSTSTSPSRSSVLQVNWTCLRFLKTLPAHLKDSNWLVESQDLREIPGFLWIART